MNQSIVAWGGVQKKKSCNIVTTYVGRRTGNYTKFINFFHGSNSSKSSKKYFSWLGWGWGVVDRYLIRASYLNFIFESLILDLSTLDMRSLDFNQKLLSKITLG